MLSVNEPFVDVRLLVVVLPLRGALVFIELPLRVVLPFVVLLVFIAVFDVVLLVGKLLVIVLLVVVLFIFIELFVFVERLVLVLPLSDEQLAPKTASDKIADNVNVLVIEKFLLFI